MPDVEASERVEGVEEGRAGFALADHWIIYTLVIALAVAVWFNVLYFVFVRFGMTGAAAFFR